MVSHKRTKSKADGGLPTSPNPQSVIEKAMIDNPEVCLVLEIAMRARVAVSSEPPRHIGVATEVITIPTNSQCPV